MTITKIAIQQKTFAIEWGDMDALGHVNNGRYFDYFQEARIEWLQTLKLDLSQATGPVVLQIGCTFLKPVIYPATLTLNTSMHTPGRSSLLIEHELYQGETLVADANSKIVWIDYKQGKSVPLPDVIRNLFPE